MVYCISTTLSPSFMQGRILTIILQKVMEALLLVGAEPLVRSLKQPDPIFISLSTNHLQVMWEANCSCRAAGYPENSIVESHQAWGNGSTCSGLPSPMDVPTRSQAAARESAAEVLQSFRNIATLVWPNHAAAANAEAAGVDRGGSSSVAAYADWEVLQADLLEAAPGAFPPLCGEGLWCFNPACTNLAGPSELALKTHACGGGCGVRYCSPECQVQGWRDGHRLSCGQLQARAARSS